MPVWAVEVAGATLSEDLRIKTPNDARVGLARLGVVDLTGRETRVMSAPAPEGFSSVARKRFGCPVAPLCAPNGQITLADLQP
jgi:hypothetical protein